MKTLAAMLLGLGIVGLAAAAVRADTVTLTDGRVIKGEVVSADGAVFVEINAAGGTLRYPASLVRSIVRDAMPAGGKPSQGADSSTGGKPVSPEPGKGASPVAPPTATGELDGAKFSSAKVQAEQAQTAAEGLEVWQNLLSANPRGSAVESARKELAVWRQRVDQDQVRFGPQWQPRAAVAEKMARADELTAKAEAEGNIDEAVKLYDQAALAHPYRADIPFRKGMRLYKAGRERQWGAAMGDVVKVDANHVGARNNMGVAAAVQKNWAAAMASLGKAAATLAASNPSSTAILDNLDLAIWLADQDDAAAAVVSGGQAQVGAVVRIMQQAGKAVGQARWGNRWVAKAEYDEYMRIDQEASRAIAANRAKLAALAPKRNQAQSAVDRQKAVIKDRETHVASSERIWSTDPIWDMRQRLYQLQEQLRMIDNEIARLQNDIKSQESKRPKASHAGSFKMMDETGADAGSVDPPRIAKPPGG